MAPRPRSRLNFLGPKFFLEAEGQVARDIARDVISFDFEQDAKKADQLTLVVANPGLKYIDDPRFAKQARWRVRFGYIGEISDTYSVLIKSAKPRFPQSGVPTITMVAFDLRMELNRDGVPRNWGAVKTSEIAQSIAEAWGLKFDVDDSDDARKQDRIQPGNVGTWRWLLDQAEKINFDAYIEGTTLHFHPKRLTALPSFEFTYFTDGTGTLLEFDPNVNLNKRSGTQQGAVNTKTGEDASDKHGDKDPQDQSRMGHFKISTGNDIGYQLVPGTDVKRPYGAEGKLEASPETDPKIVSKHAEATQSKIDMKAVEGTVKLVGCPRLKKRDMIVLKGLGQTYSGTWYVEKVRHSISGEGDVYTTQATVNRNSLNKGKAADKNTDAENRTPEKTGEQNMMTIRTGNTPGVG